MVHVPSPLDLLASSVPIQCIQAICNYQVRFSYIHTCKPYLPCTLKDLLSCSVYTWIKLQQLDQHVWDVNACCRKGVFPCGSHSLCFQQQFLERSLHVEPDNQQQHRVCQYEGAECHFSQCISCLKYRLHFAWNGIPGIFLRKIEDSQARQIHSPWKSKSDHF